MCDGENATVPFTTLVVDFFHASIPPIAATYLSRIESIVFDAAPEAACVPLADVGLLDFRAAVCAASVSAFASREPQRQIRIAETPFTPQNFHGDLDEIITAE